MKVIHKIVLLLLISLAFAAFWKSFSATAQTDQ
jgi:hypothetical protein